MTLQTSIFCIYFSPTEKMSIPISVKRLRIKIIRTLLMVRRQDTIAGMPGNNIRKAHLGSCTAHKMAQEFSK